MKKLNAMLHNEKVQANLIIVAIFAIVVTVVILTSGR
jgi:hypothetical protein